MSELNQLMNVPTEYTINDKVYSVKGLTMMELAQIRKSIFKKLNDDWKKDIIEIANSLNGKDKHKFLIDALKERVSETQVDEEMMGEYGIKVILAKTLKIDLIDVDALVYSSDPIVSDTLQKIYKAALGINTEATEATKELKEVKETTEANEVNEANEETA
jgi:hypothetical protein